MSKLTWYFKDVIADYDAFKSVLANIPFTWNQADDFIIEHTFAILYRRFSCVNIRYFTKEAFLDEFMNVYFNEIYRYIRRYKLIQDIYAISNDDIVKMTTSINNFANNPNDAPSDVLDPLEYISSQNYSVVKNNNLEAYVRALELLPSKYDKEFLDEFEYLFQQIYGQDVVIYLDEEEEE